MNSREKKGSTVEAVPGHVANREFWNSMRGLVPHLMSPEDGFDGAAQERMRQRFSFNQDVVDALLRGKFEHDASDERAQTLGDAMAVLLERLHTAEGVRSLPPLDDPAEEARVSKIHKNTEVLFREVGEKAYPELRRPESVGEIRILVAGAVQDGRRFLEQMRTYYNEQEVDNEELSPGMQAELLRRLLNEPWDKEKYTPETIGKLLYVLEDTVALSASDYEVMPDNEKVERQAVGIREEKKQMVMDAGRAIYALTLAREFLSKGS